MSSLNQVNLIGRLGADPEARVMPSGSATSNFRIATSENWKDKQTGEKKERTEWHSITAFNRLAEVCNQYLAKGSLVFISGSLRTRKWQDKNGVDRYTTEIVAQEMKMLGPKAGGDRQPAQGAAQAKPAASSTEDFDDDIPF